MRVKEIMSSPVITVRPEDRVKDVAALLVRHKISAVPVVTSGDRLVGIVSEADLFALESAPDPRLHALAQDGAGQPAPRLVQDLMTRDVVCLHPDNDTAVAAVLMRSHRVRSLPVVADGRVVGIAARRDLVNVLARDDGSIQAELQDLLAQVGLLLPYQATVRDGVVTLTGPTDAATRNVAARLTPTVPGVVAVRFASVDPEPIRDRPATRPA